MSRYNAPLADLRFARNRLRRDLLPRLERDWNPRTPEALARLAEQAAEDAEYWRLQVADCEERLFRAAPHGLVLNVEDVAALEPALRRRVLRRSLAQRVSSLPLGRTTLRIAVGSV